MKNNSILRTTHYTRGHHTSHYHTRHYYWRWSIEIAKIRTAQFHVKSQQVINSFYSSCLQSKQSQLSSPFLITLPFAARFPTCPSSFDFSFPLDKLSLVETKPGDLKFPKHKKYNIDFSWPFYECFCSTLDLYSEFRTLSITAKPYGPKKSLDHH